MKSNIKILIVEDEALTAKAIESQIRKMGYSSINIAITYKQAIAYIKKKTPDLILLDINLKGSYSGIDIANDRMVFNKISVIYLTAYKDSQTIEELKITKPKAYLTKPLRYEELEVAIYLALAYTSHAVDIGYDFSYDLDNRNLFCQKELIKLSQNERLLLEVLIDGRGEPIPLNVLEFGIWGNETVSISSLRTLVSNLRKKLNSDMIVTVVSLGYKLLLPKEKNK